jgi:hypothetical protein
LSGVVSGGWEFVTAAYVISALVFLSYTASVIARYRSEAKRRDRPE